LMLLAKPFSGDIRVNREAKTLREAGYAVRVIAWNRGSGKREYGRSSDGIDVCLIGPSCKTRDFLSLIIGIPRFFIRAFIEAIRWDHSIVHSHDFDTLPLGYVISKLKGTKLVYDAHESYADMISDDAPPIIVSIIRRFERFFLASVDLVIVSNRRVAERIGANDAVIVMNCPSRSELQMRDIGHVTDSKYLRIGYFGSLEPGRFLTEAMEIVSSSLAWNMVIGGDGTLRPELQRFVNGSDRLEYLGSLPHSDALRESARCALLLVMFDPSNYNNIIGAPNRMFEALALGIPPVVTSGTLAGEIVTEENCGFTCRYDKTEFKSLLEMLAQQPEKIRLAGENGRIAFGREYNWESQASRLLLAYQKLVGR